MPDLTAKKCAPCDGGTPAFTKAQIGEHLKLLEPFWKQVHEEGVDKIRREFQFIDFTQAMNFVNKVAALAEQERHHPDIHLWYNKVLLVLWTHAVKRLSENDFILAAKINQI